MLTNRLKFFFIAPVIFVKNPVSMRRWIIMIDDDSDMHFLYARVFARLGLANALKQFSNAAEALDFLRASPADVRIIFSDINMPKLDGFALRQKLRTDSKLSNKCIPYLFFSTALNQKSVIDAYSQSVQGFFVKQNSMAELEKTISAIMEYWRRCAAPNDFSE